MAAALAALGGRGYPAEPRLTSGDPDLGHGARRAVRLAFVPVLAL